MMNNLLDLVAKGTLACARMPSEAELDAGDAAIARDSGNTRTVTDSGRPPVDAGTRDAGSRDAGPLDGGAKDGGLKPAENEVSRYEPPVTPVFPQTISEGVSHFSFTEAGEPTNASFPLSFKCDFASASCYFGSANKSYSFATANMNNSTGHPLTMVADFSPDIDGQNSFMAATLQSGENYYGLYDSFDPSVSPGPGIAIRNSSQESLETYYFPLVGGTPITTPNGLLLNGDQLWVSTSNYIGGDDIYRAGNFFALDKNENGTLIDDASKPPLTATQFDPQALATWNTGNKTYILAVETGKSEFQGAILTESGVDVIDPASHRIVANIPLGLGTANNIAVTPDGAAGFVSSQTLSNIYVIDLERLATKLLGQDGTEETPTPFADVVIADATNPIAINPTGAEFVASIAYDEHTQTLITANYNAGTLGQINAGYQVFSGIGITLSEGFGNVLGQYECAGDGTSNCSNIDLLRAGVVGLTALPASGTFLPRENLAQ